MSVVLVAVVIAYCTARRVSCAKPACMTCRGGVSSNNAPSLAADRRPSRSARQSPTAAPDAAMTVRKAPASRCCPRPRGLAPGSAAPHAAHRSAAIHRA